MEDSMNLSERYMKSQSGRTMLESLIVVALVGLLSLLPLEIYNYAIDKYRSNVLKDEILQRSADLKQQIDNHKKNFNLDKWDPYSKIGVPINFIENDAYEQNSIGIQITHIEKRICNMTLDGLENVARIRVNDVLYSADAQSLCKGNDKITLYFNPLSRRNINKKSPEHCPANTPKNADPNTCECDLTQRYFQESTNECVCWSGEEIDGVCMNVCATSADCDDNEICENHICIKYDNTTTMEPMNTTEVPETTYTTSTTILETSTPETTSAPYTTTSWYETTTSTYTTTSQYETTIPETTTFVCPEEKPHYDTDTHTCVECLTDTDCENMAICSSDKTCICQMTDTECLSSEFNPTQCMCCPSEAPVYDSVSGMCKTCDEMHPEWAETGSGYDIATKQCWAYCKKQEVGVVMMVDRSPSTFNNTIQGRRVSDVIMNVLRQLKIPEKMQTTIYMNDYIAFLSSSYTISLDSYVVLNYGYHSAEKIRNKLNSMPYYSSILCTSLSAATMEVTSDICPAGDKLLILMWSDGLLDKCMNYQYDWTKQAMKALKNKCSNAKFYYIGPNSSSMSYYDKFYPIASLPEEYVDSLNDFIRQEGCIPKK